MTDEQIIKASEYCSTDVRENTCPKCAFYKKHRCSTLMLNAVSDLTKRQKTEIEELNIQLQGLWNMASLYKAESERWKGYNENLLNANTVLSNEILESKANAKTEAIREFAEALKESADNGGCGEDFVYVSDIDILVKEMTEGE